MTRSNPSAPSRRAGLLAAILGASAGACGADGDIVSATIRAPSPQEARVTITPAVDLTGIDAELASDLMIDQVVINLSDARLLGEDPRIPVGGYPLLSEPMLVYAEGGRVVGLELPFPREFLGQEDLAVYLRTEPSAELGDASMVVVAKVAHASQALSRSGSVDPDGEPVDVASVDPDGEPVDVGSVDPDGEPVDVQSVDPDGEPVDESDAFKQARQGLGEGESGRQVVLVDRAGTELVVTFGRRSSFNVVFGIRAASWIGDDVAASLNAPASQAPGAGDAPSALRPTTSVTPATVLLEAGTPTIDGERGRRDGREGNYFGSDDIPVEDGSITGIPPGF